MGRYIKEGHIKDIEAVLNKFSYLDKQGWFLPEVEEVVYTPMDADMVKQLSLEIDELCIF